MRSICASRGSPRSTSSGSPTAQSGFPHRARPGEANEAALSARGEERRPMKSNRKAGPRAAWALRVAALASMALLVSRPGFAQFDLTGKWASRSGQDAQERGPGPDAVDYAGLPLSDEGRARALAL